MFKLDPTTRPRSIDLYYLDENGNPQPGILIPGIYKLDGDLLTLCLNIGGRGPEDRPQEFATHPPNSPWLDVYQRDPAAQELPPRFLSTTRQEARHGGIGRVGRMK